jgi:nucleoside-diphosphate-sugar epimerase
MKILITGQSGFIGKHLTNAIKKTGHEIISADLSNGIDICDFNQLESLERPELIIHLANLSFVPASFVNPAEFYRVNYISTLNVLELCRKFKIGLIYFSSYIYGRPEYQPIDEKHPIKAFNPYAQTKVLCESLCEGYNRDFGINITIFRPFNIYGPGQNPDFLIPQMITQALKEQKISVKNDQPKRDYIHIFDVVSAITKAVNKQKNDGKLAIYNLGTGNSHSVKEVAYMIMENIHVPIVYECSGETRPNEVMDTIADISLIYNELNWIPKISLNEGISAMIEKYKQV